MRYNPRLSAKEIKENYKHFNERALLYKARGLDFIKNREFILKMAHPLRGSILEIGTGTGRTSIALAKAGYKFVSIDNDKEVLKIAALNLAYANILSSVKLYVMDGESTDFKNRSFENIFCVNLFHHIDKVNKILLEVDKLLCVNGKVILVDFNKRGMEIVNTVHKEEGYVHKNSNVTKDSVYSYFSGLGYEIKDYEDKCHWVLIGKKLLNKNINIT